MMKIFKNISSVLFFAAYLSGCGYIRGVNFDSTIGQIFSTCNTSMMEGVGSATTPYIICNANQFAQLKNAIAGEYYVIGKDIEFDSTADKIDSFAASLDGQDHTLSNFSYTNPSEDEVGLFGVLSAAANVSNLKLQNFKIAGYDFSGALAGRSAATLSNITLVDSTITGSNDIVGGLIGRDQGSHATHITISNTSVVGMTQVGLYAGRAQNSPTLDQSTLQGYVTGAAYVGGVSGYALDTTLNQVGVFTQVLVAQDDFFAASGWSDPEYFMIGAGFAVGGMFGHTSNVSVTDSYFIGSVLNTEYNYGGVQGIAGFAPYADGTTTLMNYYQAPNQIIDMSGMSFVIDTMIAQNSSATTAGEVDYYSHANLPASASLGAPMSAAQLEDETQFVINGNFDFATPIWKMANTSTFKFPVLAHQSATEPFGDVAYRSDPVMPIYITEGWTSNGLTFETTNSDTPAYIFVTLNNTSGLPIQLKSIQTGGVRDAFSIVTFGAQAGNCSGLVGSAFSLANGQTCNIGIKYYPFNSANVIGELNRDALLVKYTIAGIETTLMHPIDGKGALVGAYLSNYTLSFSDTIIDQIATTSPLSLYNEGNQTGTIVSYHYSGDSEFTIDYTACLVGTTITSGNTCGLNVDFHPTSIGSFTGNLEIVYENGLGTNKTVTYTINANGIPHPFPGDNSPDCLSGNGTLTNPYCITSKTDLETMTNNLGLYGSSYFLQIDDIDLGELGDVSTAACSTYNFTPMTLFNGVYDGDNHTISNLCSTHSAGFAIRLSDAGVIKNLNFINLQVTGTGYYTVIDGMMTLVGGVVGWLSNSASIDHVTIQSGKVDGSSAKVVVNPGAPNGHVTGGIIAAANGQATVTHSSANMQILGVQRVGVGFGYIREDVVFDDVTTSGSVTAESNMAGGLGGFANGGGISGSSVLNCSSSAAVVSGPVYFGYGSGGLLGSLGSSTVVNSYATGSVTGIGQLGGLIGLTRRSNVSGSFATGAVTGTGDTIGGFVGYSQASTITDCFTMGSVSAGGNNVGGFAGYSGHEAAIISTLTHNYASTATFSAPSAAAFGGFVGGESGTSVFTENYFYLHGSIPADAFLDNVALDNTVAATYIDDIVNYVGFVTPGTWRTRNASPDGTGATPVLTWMCGLTISGSVVVCQ